MIDILFFALENAFVLHNGKLLHQVAGIPMGGPISPGMTIGTCAWMEQEWLKGIHPTDTALFRAARYMDDVLMFRATPATWDHDKFAAAFKTECYFPPLNLVEVEGHDFLESTIHVANGKARHWLKNVNVPGEAPKVWRYQNFGSYSPLALKSAVFMCSLQKVHFYASDEAALFHSACQKVDEFARLGYPGWLRRKLCCRMAISSRCKVWLAVRDMQPQ